tara:strand:- start:169 stop:321 length:153 start_codon:yes stop_codon:yes gene_type:complete
VKLPEIGAAFWRQKIRTNVERDAVSPAALEEAGWTVLVVWEGVRGSTRDA